MKLIKNLINKFIDYLNYIENELTERNYKKNQVVR